MRVRPEVGITIEPLVGVLVDAVVREVARKVKASVRRRELGGDVLPFVPCRALYPIGRLLVDRGDPGVRLAAEQRSGVEAHVEPLAFVFADGRRRSVGPLGCRIVCQVVEGAAQCLDRAGGDVGRPLGHLDPPEVHRVDEPVGLSTAEVVGCTVGEPIDGRADLRLADGHLEAAHGDVARPVVEAVRIALLDGYPGQVVDHRRHAGDVRLLEDHRLGDDIAREDPRLLSNDADSLESDDAWLQANIKRGDARTYRQSLCLESHKGKS